MDARHGLGVAEVLHRADVAGQDEAFAVEVGLGGPAAGVLDLDGAGIKVQNVAGVVVGVEARTLRHLMDVADRTLDLAHARLGPIHRARIGHDANSLRSSRLSR